VGVNEQASFLHMVLLLRGFGLAMDLKYRRIFLLFEKKLVAFGAFERMMFKETEGIYLING